MANAFDMGGIVSGEASSISNQLAKVQFLPTVDGVSPAPAGQGLATINTAFPASAAFLPTTYGAAAAAPATSSSASLLLLIGAAGIAAWFLLRKKHR